MMVKRVLNKKPIDINNNAISFLNSLTEEEIKKANIQYRVLVIMWARKLVNKYDHLETVQANIDVMHHQIKGFIELFNLYSKEGFLSFGKRKEECCIRMSKMRD